MKKVNKNNDSLWNAWGELYKFYANYYFPENDAEWIEMYEESMRIADKYHDVLVEGILHAILCAAEKRSRVNKV